MHKSDLLTCSCFTRTHVPFEGLGVLRLGLAWRPIAFGLHDPPQVLISTLVPLSGRSSPSVLKVGSLSASSSADATEPSGLFVTPYWSPADMLGDVFEAWC